MELFEEIRREYHAWRGHDSGSGEEVGHASADGAAGAGQRDTAGAQAHRHGSSPKLGPVREFIDAILQSDRASAAQAAAHGAPHLGADWAGAAETHVAEATVRRYVRRRKQELGVAGRETFVPQSYDWGVEAQVDWYEAVAEVEGERQTVHYFSMRAWPAAVPFMRPTTTPRSRPFWKRTSWPFTISAGCSGGCATTT